MDCNVPGVRMVFVKTRTVVTLFLLPTKDVLFNNLLALLMEMENVPK